MTTLDPAARVRIHVTEVLADGPMAFDALVAALVARGLSLGPDPDDRVDSVLDEMDSVDWLTVDDPDERGRAVDVIYDAARLLEDTTWTVPIEAIDLASGTLSSEALGPIFTGLAAGRLGFDGAGTDGLQLDVTGLREAAATQLDMAPDPSAGIGVVPPPGWLEASGVDPGGHLFLHVSSGIVSAQVTNDVPRVTAALAGPLLDVVGHVDDAGRSRPMSEVLTELLVTHSDLRPTAFPPLSDWFTAAGIARRGLWVAPPGFDFDAESFASQVAGAMDEFDLTEADAGHFADVTSIWQQWVSPTADTPDRAALAQACSALDSLDVAATFSETATEMAGGTSNLDDVDERLVSFGEALIDAGSGPHRAGAAWVVAQAHGRAGRTRQFEDWIDTALGFDANHPMSLYDKSGFEFDRGELRRAKALLERLGMGPENHDINLINSVLQPAFTGVGRNDPCPCGSGRKYKRCHLGIDDIPLGSRLTLLYRKANRWLDYRYHSQVHAAAWVRSGSSGVPAREILQTDPLVPDVVLTEGGRFEQWLAERGPLLPSDEAMLAAQWALVERSVYEVTAVRLDEGLTLRDVRTGDVVDVVERIGTHGMSTGIYILARPLPVHDGTLQFFGGITFVPDPMLHEFIEVLDRDNGPTDILRLVARSEAPPLLRNTAGEDFMLCQTTWRVDDVVAARSALDEAFEPVAIDEWKWLGVTSGANSAETAGADPGATAGSAADAAPGATAGLAPGATAGSAPGATAGSADGDSADGRTVLATLGLEGDQLTVDTNSEERAERISELIGSIMPDATMLEDLRSSLDDIRADKDYEDYIFGGDEPDDGDLDSSDDHFALPGGMMSPSDAPPEIQEALRRQIEIYEHQWVDEQIPALGGATPREALQDPTRRDDLMRLLDRMARRESSASNPAGSFAMRTARLRELLGLGPDDTFDDGAT